jgi:hypothetical protein
MIKAGNDPVKRLDFKTNLTRQMILGGFTLKKRLAVFQFIDVAVTLPPEVFAGDRSGVRAWSTRRAGVRLNPPIFFDNDISDFIGKKTRQDV